MGVLKEHTMESMKAEKRVQKMDTQRADQLVLMTAVLKAIRSGS